MSNADLRRFLRALAELAEIAQWYRERNARFVRAVMGEVRGDE